MADIHDQAIQWAQANPQDPRAQDVMAKAWAAKNPGPIADKINEKLNAPPVSQIESAGRGALQGLTLGTSDELTGAAQAAWDKTFGKVADSHAKFLDLYKQHRDEARANNDKARKDNPGTYLAGNLAGGIVPGIATAGLGAGPVLGGAALGATAGLGNSDTDLTTGDSGQIKQALKDTAVSGVVGGALGQASKIVGGIRSGEVPERMAISSLNAAPEEAGAMLKGVGIPNRDSVGRTMLDNKVMGRMGFSTNNGMAERLQKTSDLLGDKQSALIDKLGNKSADLDTIKQNIMDKMGTAYSTEGNKAVGYVEGQMENLPQGEGSMSLKDLAAVKKEYQGLSSYPSQGSPSMQDVSNAGAMTKATSGIRKTMGDLGGDELNNQLRSESNIFQARDAMRSSPPLNGGLLSVKGFGRFLGNNYNKMGAALTDTVSKALQYAPESLGKYASTLSAAAQRSPESLKATLHVLQMSDPEFRQMTQPSPSDDSQ